LLITPHVAFYSPEGYEEMRVKAALEAKRVLEGQPPRNPILP
jgi:C-terminal binding protein